MNPLGPFAMHDGFPALGLLRALRPTPAAIGGRRVNPLRPRPDGQGTDGNLGVVPTFTMQPIDG